MDMIRVRAVDSDPVKIQINDVYFHTRIYRNQNPKVSNISVDSNSLKFVIQKFDIVKFVHATNNNRDVEYESTLEINIGYDEKNKEWIVTQSQI